MQLSCCSTFVLFFSQFGFFHLSLSEKQLFCGFCPSKNIYLKTLWRYLRHGSSWFSAWCRWKNWGRSFVCLCACACVYASQWSRRFNGPPSTPNRPNTETTVTSPRESVSIPTTARRRGDSAGSLASQTHVNQLRLVGPNSKRSSVRVDKFTAGAPCLERESREKKRDETRRVPPLWLIHPGVNVHLRRGNTAQP